jgi:DNA-binding NarL/FixJ family response regulator
MKTHKKEISRPRTGAAPRKKIFIVDDHPMTRSGLAQLIEHEPDLAVCGEAENAQQALAALKPPLPDLILCDITMPGKNGLEFIKDLKALYPEVVVLVMSMHDESLYAERVLRAGGSGYIMKNVGGNEVLEGIRQVLSGKNYLSKNMSATLVDEIVRGRPSRNRGDIQLSLLTDREFEVFALLGQGFSARDIGERLHISPKTVETHRVNIKEKFGLKSGTDLVKHAVRWAVTNQLI